MKQEKRHLAIPKIIHFCWFGPLDYQKDPLVTRCIESWKQFLPNHEIKIWNEKNSPMDHPFVKAAYEAKKWAFVSDYVRFWALYNEGGLYLDTDMEIVKSLDGFLDSNFVGFDKQGTPSCGIMSFSKHHPILNKLLSVYDETVFEVKKLSNITSPSLLTKTLILYGMTDYCNENQDLETITLYNHDYFYPFNAGETLLYNSTFYAIHHWNESWVSFPKTRKLFRKLGIMNLFKKLLDIFKVRELLKSLLDKHRL